MTQRAYPALQVNASGANLATGAASASVAIPNNAAGQKARFVRVLATAACYVRLGGSGVTAAVADLYVDAGGAGALVLNVLGSTHIAAIQVAAAGLLNVTPLDD